MCRKASKETPVAGTVWGGREQGTAGGGGRGRKKLEPLPGVWNFIHHGAAQVLSGGVT